MLIAVEVVHFAGIPTVAGLASDEAGHLTGVAVPVDAGLFVR